MTLLMLKVHYAKAVKDGEKQFTLEGHDFLVAYVKYMIQYLESVCKELGLKDSGLTLGLDGLQGEQEMGYGFSKN